MKHSTIESVLSIELYARHRNQRDGIRSQLVRSGTIRCRPDQLLERVVE